MKNIVIYYSNNGSNSYLAKKISTELNCEIREIRPYLNFPMLFWLGLNFGFRKIKADLSSYNRIILVGPVWMGKFIIPLKAFVNKNLKKINKLVFVTCCGSSYKKKDDKFGHAFVFKEVRKILNEKCELCQAFPITLVIPEEQQEEGEVVMNTRLNDETFKGEVKERFEAFIESIKQKN